MYNNQKLSRRKKLNQKGYGGLIIAVLFLSAVMFYLSVPLFLESSIALKDANLRVARRYSEEAAIAATAPIADDVQKQVVTLVQESLFDRIAKAKSGVTYTCQDGSTSGEAALSNTFAICDPVGVLDEVEGAQNQFMNDIDAFLPNLGTHANEPQYQAIKRYLTNDYSYTLSPVFVAKKLVDPGNRQITPKIGISKNPLDLPRIEQYRFLVRADIVMHTYDKVTWRLFANYDLILETEFHNNGKAGGFADSCDGSKLSSQVGLVVPTLMNSTVGPNGVGINCYDVGGPEGYSTCGIAGAYGPNGNY